MPLGLKFGAEQSEAEGLLAEAKRRGLQVVGVSFHIGSSCKNLAAYGAAIAAARRAFDLGARMGHGAMALLDIGGGFTGRFDARGGVEIAGLVRAVNGALDLNIPPGCGVRVISEPGRFFAEASAAIAARVCGKRDRRPGPPPAGAAPAAVTTAAAPGDVGGDAAGVHKDYWLSDGLYGRRPAWIHEECVQYAVTATPQQPMPTTLTYGPVAQPAPCAPVAGSFNCVLMDDYVPRPLILSSPLLPPPPAGVAAQGAAAAAAAAGHERVFCSTLWGPTCDSADVLTTTALLPELRIGDWLMFERMGAYTISVSARVSGRGRLQGWAPLLGILILHKHLGCGLNCTAPAASHSPGCVRLQRHHSDAAGKALRLLRVRGGRGSGRRGRRDRCRRRCGAVGRHLLTWCSGRCHLSGPQLPA